MALVIIDLLIFLMTLKYYVLYLRLHDSLNFYHFRILHILLIIMLGIICNISTFNRYILNNMYFKDKIFH